MEGLNIIPGFASNMLSRFSVSFQQLIKDLGESKTITVSLYVLNILKLVKLGLLYPIYIVYNIAYCIYCI